MAGMTKKELIARKISAAVSKKRPDVLNKLEAAFAFDATIEEACFYAGISHQTYYTWVKEDSDLLERFNALRNTPVLSARQEVVKGLVGNPEFSMRYLQNKRPDEFGHKTKVEMSGKLETDDTGARAALKEASREISRRLKDEVIKQIKANKAARAVSTTTI